MHIFRFLEHEVPIFNYNNIMLYYYLYFVPKIKYILLLFNIEYSASK